MKAIAVLKGVTEMKFRVKRSQDYMLEPGVPMFWDIPLEKRAGYESVDVGHVRELLEPYLLVDSTQLNFRIDVDGAEDNGEMDFAVQSIGVYTWSGQLVVELERVR